ncbi:MAG TPA: tRNA pseudouridine(13) synthase TruD [Phycisphaerae bacterium]|nr:tRNA pseudouridine(13) synthase TruD [Phycisphaerae bacterium]
MLSVDELPFLTADIPGLGGRIKARPEDFVVEELSLYEPSGEGTHVYFQIEKVGIPTMRAVHEIARALDVRAHDIGYAGQKDADAVTRQTLSLEHVDPRRIEQLNVPRIRVLGVSRHTNKLRLGHLAGNRFTIRLRDVDVGRLDRVRAVLDRLMRHGVPNYFGPQRFGFRGDTWQIGLAILRGDYDEALHVMLGRPGPQDHGEARRARDLFEQGDYAGAANAWPYLFSNERRVCRAMVKAKGKARRAFHAIDKNMRLFYLSAYQSHLFNQIVARRIDGLDRLMPGDLAWRHPQGAVFPVEDIAREQPRCDAFEISPTGPLFGHRMSMPTGQPGEWESELLSQTGMTPESFKAGPDRTTKGSRRPVRFQPHDSEASASRDQHGDHIELTFRLESGCYATTVLREICKTVDSTAE